MGDWMSPRVMLRASSCVGMRSQVCPGDSSQPKEGLEKITRSDLGAGDIAPLLQGELIDDLLDGLERRASAGLHPAGEDFDVE